MTVAISRGFNSKDKPGLMFEEDQGSDGAGLVLADFEDAGVVSKGFSLF